MRKLVSFVFSFFLFHSLLFAQINPIKPSWIVHEELKNVKTATENEVKDGYYYLLVDEQYNTVKKQNYFHYATKIITEAGLDYASQIEVNFDPTYQSAAIHEINIIRNGKVINKADRSSIKILNEEKERNQGILSGYKTFYVNLSDVRKGDIVEYSYTINGYNKVLEGTLNYDLTVSYAVPVGRLFYRILLPKGDSLSVKNINTDITFSKKTGQINDYSWSVDQPKLTKVENNTPIWYDPYPRIQLTTLKNWMQVKQKLKELFVLKEGSQQTVDKLAATLLASGHDTKTNITKAVDFVQNQIRYSGNENGIYSHKPHEPGYVLANSFGDCKDKSLLLCALLRSIKVEAYPVLLSTTLKGTVEEQSPSFNKFDHCIVAINWKNKYYYIDPTYTFQKGDFTERVVGNYEMGMVVDNTDNIFRKIEPNLIGNSVVKESFEVDELSGDAKLKVECIYTGPNANLLRSYFGSNAISDIQEDYKKYYLKYSGDVEVIDSLRMIDDSTKNECTTIEYYLLKGFWTPDSSSKSKVISKDFLPYFLNEKLLYVDDNNRKDPLALTYPANVHQIITVTKSGGWNITPETFKENNIFYNFSMITKAEGQTLTLDYTYEALKSFVPTEEYKLYKAKMEILNTNLVFSTTQNTGLEENKSFNWLLLLVIFVSIILSLGIWYVLYSKPFESHDEKRYTGIGGWLVLVAIGSILTPFTLFIQLLLKAKEDFAINYFTAFFDTTSANYQPLKGYYMVGADFCNVFLFVSSIFVAILFFQKKSSFRMYYALFRAFNLLFLIIDLVFLYYFYGDSSEYAERNLITSQWGAIVKIFVQSAIWVPYVWYSERSRHTFTESSNIPARPKADVAAENKIEFTSDIIG